MQLNLDWQQKNIDSTKRLHIYASLCIIMKMKKKVAVVGARGYSGIDLVRILLSHPHAELKACFATEEFKLSDYLSEDSAKSVAVLSMNQLEVTARAMDTVFLATPAETSIELAPRLLQTGANVIDLSGAFRLKGTNLDQRRSLYSHWYGIHHPAAELIDQAEYGLVPWIDLEHPHKNKTQNPRLISNPGCYATAILMALLPLLRSDLILPESLVIDAKSGTSGAGRKPAEHLLLTEVDGECLPYRIGKHQHLPEICEFAKTFGKKEIDPFLSTHLLNIRRGIIAGIYAKLRPGIRPEQVQEAYETSYHNYTLVRWGQISKTSSRWMHPLLSLKRVVGSARTQIGYEIDGSKLYVYSSIDNLLKGAASQAIENLNRLWELPMGTALNEREGLL